MQTRFCHVAFDHLLALSTLTFGSRTVKSAPLLRLLGTLCYWLCSACSIICDSCCFGICETLPMTYCIHPCIDVPRHTQQRRWWTIFRFIFFRFSLYEGMRAHTRTRTFCKHVCEHVGINSLLCVLMACALKPFFGWSGRKKIEGRTGMIQSEDPIFCSKWS